MKVSLYRHRKVKPNGEFKDTGGSIRIEPRIVGKHDRENGYWIYITNGRSKGGEELVLSARFKDATEFAEFLFNGEMVGD